jgi:DNA-binding helix-hairpin-helix protein with protein kinase domain
LPPSVHWSPEEIEKRERKIEKRQRQLASLSNPQQATNTNNSRGRAANTANKTADSYDNTRALDAIHALYPTDGMGMKIINTLRAQYGKQVIDKALQSYTFGQFKTAYMPDENEQRVRKIISMAKSDGRAQDEAAARQEIMDYWDESDEDIASVLSETRSRILKGILG